MKEDKNKWIFGIALSGNEDEEGQIDGSYKEMMKKDYDLSNKDISKLKMAYLFRLSDNIRYYAFDADIVLYSDKSETYYHTGEFEPTGAKENKDIIALCDENGECENV